MRNFKLFPISAIIAIVILGSCKKDKDPLDNMTMAFDSESYEIHENEDFALYKHLTITPESVADTVTVDWSSSDENIVYVKKAGRVTGVVCGEAVVTATSHGKSASCKIVVKEIPIEWMSIPKKMRLPDATKTVIDISVMPDDASTAHIKWTSTVPDVKPLYDAELGQWCIQTDYIGDATLTATYGSLEPQQCEVTIYDHTIVHVSKFFLSSNISPSSDINLQSNVMVYAYDITPEDANYSEIIFSVDKPELATLSKPAYDATNKRYYCYLYTNTKSGEVVVTAKARDDEMTKRTIRFYIAKKDIESVSMPNSDIVSKAGSSIYMGNGYTITPSDAHVENLSFVIKTDKGEIVDKNIMEYKKNSSKGTYELVIGSATVDGRYSVVANADGVLSEPMYVNVISKDWVLNQIDNDRFTRREYSDGYRIRVFGTLGMREKISPKDMMPDYKKMDQSLKDVLWMTYDGVMDNSQKAFYFIENYKTGYEISEVAKNSIEFDYPFQQTEVGKGSTMRKGTFKCTLYVGPVNGKTISIPLYFEIYASYLRMFRVRTDINGNRSTSDLNYVNDCMCVGSEKSGNTRYQDAVELWIEYADNVNATYGVTKQFKFWNTGMNVDGGELFHSWNCELNAFPIDFLHRNKNSKLPVSEGRDIHLTIRFHGAQHAECTYDPDPEHPQ